MLMAIQFGKLIIMMKVKSIRLQNTKTMALSKQPKPMTTKMAH